MMKKNSTATLSLLTLLILTGCGGQTDSEQQNVPSPIASGVVSTTPATANALAQESGFMGAAPRYEQAANSAVGSGTMFKQSALVADGTPLAIDTSDREAVRQFFNKVYMEPRVSMGWTGSYTAGNGGTINVDYQRSTIQRVNWFRAMAGVPASVTLSSANSSKAQQAAFMMSANNALSHTPSSSWKFYTAAGAEGALSSNIVLGSNGPDAVDTYMKDFGDNNGAVGHRRWLLFPGTKTFGTGDVPAGELNGQGLWGGNALWVTDADFYSTRPQVRDGFVAWPSRGFVPHQAVFARWSFSYPAADFSQARVAVTRDGTPLDIRMETVVNGTGENTVVWQVPGIEPNGRHVKPTADIKYQVTVSNVFINQQNRSFTYDVIVFDTGALFQGTHASYTLTMQDSVLTLMDNTGREGTQTVRNPVRVDFADVSLGFDVEGNAGKAYRLYRAAFNRKPDASGLGFWIYAMDRGQSIKEVAREFSRSPEFATLYGASPTHAQLVRAMYLNVLHREPDATGAAFWMQAMANGLPVEQLLVDFSESAENKAQVASEIRLGIMFKRFGQ